jgi:hypothetical protein
VESGTNEYVNECGGGSGGGIGMGGGAASSDAEYPAPQALTNCRRVPATKARPSLTAPASTVSEPFSSRKSLRLVKHNETGGRHQICCAVFVLPIYHDVKK